MADLCTVTEAKTYLGVSGSDDDTVIGNMIAAAQAAMEGFCGRHLAAATVTETRDGTGKYNLWLSEPAETVTSIHVSASQDWSSGNLIDSDDYVVDGCQIERLDSIWPRAQRNVRAIYAAGFATTPGDLAEACKIQVAKLYTDWQTAKQGLNTTQSIRMETFAQAYLAHAGLDPSVAAVLENYIPEAL